ncbi:hypothetical protein CC86DRAFT_463309 [Ophiobolus disseminans]|uniref:Uncharacterized protein n=1 Tax=Ophiobolus disseminans TaxID=1469910 RepID=A0A6A7ADN6_9PLEO|nr:hypothetical protein CC86DRAFT_463309 [Ophiobolus disseminans]
MMATAMGRSQKDADELTERNQRESPLLRLQGELRNRIYSYVFDDDVQVEVSLTKKNERVIRDDNPHAEAGVLPYKLCVFRFTSVEASTHFLQGLAAKQLDAITLVGLSDFQAFTVGNIGYGLHAQNQDFNLKPAFNRLLFLGRKPLPGLK